MTTDLKLILRKWAFDFESKAIGELRVANIDIEKFFKEHEAAIRTGDLEGPQLARTLLQKMARKLTGDATVDKACDGPLLEPSELELLAPDELDLFADSFMKGRLWIAAPKGSAPIPPRTATGCAALASALTTYADAARASRDELLKTIKRDLSAAETMKSYLSAADQIEAQWNQATAVAAGAPLTSFLEAERVRQEAQRRSMFGFESIADRAVKDWKHQDDQLRGAMGYVGDGALVKSISPFQQDGTLAAAAVLGYGADGAIAKSMASFQQAEKLAAGAALGYVTDGGIAKWMEQHERDQKSAANVLGMIKPDMLGFAGMTAAERIGMAAGGHGPLTQLVADSNSMALARSSLLEGIAEPENKILEFTPPPYIHPPANPAHETNKIVGELLEHQREVDAKKEQAEAKKEAESVAAAATSRSSLFYTKLSFWVPFLISVGTIVVSVWVFYQQKAEAAENAKVAAAEIAKQRAENRELVDLLRKSIESRPSSSTVVKPARSK